MKKTFLPLHNKIALVTGSGRGIGRAIALKLASEGADLIINFSRNEKPAQETAALIRKMGNKALVVKANISKEEDLNILFSSIQSNFGALDILIHNAATGFNRPAMQQKITGWDYTMAVNARALLFAVQKAVPLFEAHKGGVVISISSPGSYRVMPDYIAVGASKAALESLTRYLAVELSPYNIIVNAVSPGLVETDALKHFALLSDPDVLSRAIARTPAGRLVTPEDVAGLVTFLCTPAAEMIRGQVIIMDGGFTLPVPT